METILSELMLAPDKVEFFFDSGLSVITLGCGIGFAFGFFSVVLFLAFCAFCGFCVFHCLDWLYRLIKFYVKNHPKKDEEVS